MLTNNFIGLFLIILCLPSLQAYPTFDEYCAQFGKNYSPEEYQIRKQNYEDRIASFALITAYTPGVNERTDWSQEQISASNTLQLLPVEDRQDSLKLLTNRLGVPESKDWRAEGIVTSIKNQGSCGACWAFASAAYGESKLIQQNSGYTTSNTDLSEQFILKCTKYSDCAGGYLEYAFETAREVPYESNYPYMPLALTTGICSASGVRVGYSSNNYYDLTDTDLITLLQVGPVAIAIASGGWESYSGGIFQCSSTAKVDHAVLLVGYTSSHWIVKNQWGLSFGQSGYIRITRDRTLNRNCQIGVSAFTMSESLSKYVLLSLLILASIFV